MRLSAGMPMIGRCRDMFIILSDLPVEGQPRDASAALPGLSK
jgi:hypothetical protein